VHELVPEQCVRCFTSQRVSDVNVGAERDGCRAVRVGHPVARMDMDSGEIRAELRSETARFIGLERLCALSRPGSRNQLLYAAVSHSALQLQNFFVRGRGGGRRVDLRGFGCRRLYLLSRLQFPAGHRSMSSLRKLEGSRDERVHRQMLG
jgi:hypothetical protein